MKLARSAYAFAAVVLSLAGAPSPAATVPSMSATGAGSPEEPSPEFKALRERGFALHDAARDGDRSAAGKAVELLERYLDRFSNDGGGSGLAG